MRNTHLRVGFIGAGANTRLRHLPGLKAIDGVELSVVANRTVESGKRVATEFGVKRLAAHWREVVEDPAVDAVCIGTWPDLHAEITIAALAAGKHVLVEARMARNVAEARLMLAAAAARPDLVAQIVPSPFTLNADAKIQALVARGRIGDLREIVVEHATSVYVDSATPLTWRQDKQISGVNTMALGICYEPLLRWFEGDGEVVAADARVYTTRRLGPNGDNHEIEIPESVTVLGRWTGGARLVMHQTSVEVGANRCLFRLVGSRATLVFDAQNQTLRMIDSSGGSEEIEILNRPQQGWNVEAEFAASITKRAPVTLTDFSTGLRYMRFTEEVWEAWS